MQYLSYKDIIIIFALLLLAPQGSSAVSADDLREEIAVRNSEVAELEVEITEYQEELDRIGGVAQTLEEALKKLDITNRKLTTDIRITEKSTERTALTIDALTIEIHGKEEQIGNNALILSDVVRKINALETTSLVEIIFSHDSLSAFWSVVKQLEDFETSVHKNLQTLRALKDELERKKDRSEGEKRRLELLRNRFIDQQALVAGNKREKAQLLGETQSKESNYKALLEERLSRREALEQEIAEFEARLRTEIEPGSLPETGIGVLRWPLQKVKVTQYFGNTPFASKNPQVYSGKGHNGIDLRASVGTPVYSAGGGVVADTGDTDKQCFGASYGKWVLIRHHNGLSTLYAHLSLTRALPAQEIKSGDVIGYSGDTGYSTGPHLHFTVFATKAVRVTDSYRSRVCGTFLKLPLSAQNGYLNPLSYLPTVL